MKIDFEFQTEFGVFRDAIWFPDGAQIPTDAEIEQIKLQRLQQWLGFVTPQDTQQG